MVSLVKEFKKYPKEFELKVCVTAQHREMLDQVLNIFNIIPDFDLNIMKANQNLYDVTSNILVGIKKVIDSFMPEIVFIHGDTTTSFATALGCFYSHIEIAHIEAGLRTYNIYNPWPEEANRQLTSKLAKYHFAPTLLSRDNLLNEGIKESNIIVTGNTVIDTLFIVIDKIHNNNEEKKLAANIGLSFEIENNKYILVTGHRRENFGEGIMNLCMALKKIALINPNLHIVYPVHLNPNVRKPVLDELSDIKNIHLINPMGYEEFAYLMSKSYFIITDSGGIQEEAPSLGIPVLVTRNTTERLEAVKAGTVKLIGSNKDMIVNEAQSLLNDNIKYIEMSKSSNPYGNGGSCRTIVDYFRKRTHD